MRIASGKKISMITSLWYSSRMISMITTHIIVFISGHEVLGNVDWEDVGEELLVVRLQVLHLLLLLCK